MTLSCSVASAQAAVLVERLRSPPEGLCGGGAGTPTRVLVDGESLEDCARPIQMSQSTLLTVESAGGGGYGLALGTEE
jgi:N-methylhydantoinase B/oxoprolinase/acetone carboxylase alpha subunit